MRCERNNSRAEWGAVPVNVSHRGAQWVIEVRPIEYQVFSTPEMIKNFVSAIPLGRVGKPIECATVIAFLASDAAGYVIGETIEINGGQLML